MIRFTVTPARITVSRLPGVPCRKVRGSSAGSTSSMLVIPMIRT